MMYFIDIFYMTYKGYFDDTTAGHFGEYKNDSNIYRTKGKQFITGQPGDYFDKKFKRLFEGENSKELRADKIKVHSLTLTR